MINYLKELGATRIAFLLLIFNLNALMWFALIYYPETRFLTIFAVFSNIISGITGFFTARSIGEANVRAQQSVDNSTSQAG